jgi:hypothetical protein
MILVGYVTIAAGIYSYHYNRGLPLDLVWAHAGSFAFILLGLEAWH